MSEPQAATQNVAAQKPHGGDNRPPSPNAVNRALGKSITDVVAAVDAARAAKATKEPAAKEASPPATETASEADTPSPAVASEPASDAVPAVVEEKKEPPKEGRLLADLRAREAKLVEAKQRFARERSGFDAYRKRTEAELTEARERNALAAKDPFAYLERYHGVKRESFGIATGKDPGPSVALEQANARIAQLEQMMRQSSEQRALDEFERRAKGGGERWPLASRYSAQKLRTRGWEIATRHASEGVTLTDEEVLDKIEEELSEIASLRTPKPSTSSTPKPPAPSGPKPQSPPHPTLTSHEATDSASVPVKATSFKRRHDMIAHTARAVEEALRARKPAAR